MDIDEVIEILSEIEEENITITNHFIERCESRKDKLPNISKIKNMLLTQKPVGILKQSGNKFRLYYELDEKYDLIIVISVWNTNPIEINLVTTYPQEKKKRERKDERI
ncbi:hypothetical protein QIT38_gp35 [Methanocaldococcus fervens tailed virus 1]|uniref:Plasmid stabilization system n=2 Tax=root TaxID=1 RepID=C7P5J7_METFA|nr:hypothetical protein [Methanocaldococcus fervens]YP_010772330.1 hypothetical protein QIT38_gp35 [Methanocaldococcus fervens tailed virus 1]ACV25375.1 hypothetical protein Mefer_1572 [Methanocaldococcus fervens AG86]QNO11505.1 hypothetical protein [Methanocaldococcus fervens tailed virus 1]